MFKAFYEGISEGSGRETNANIRDEVAQRISRYVEGYRREVASLSGQSLQVGDEVLIMKPYNLRRRALDCLYREGRFKIIEITRGRISVEDQDYNIIVKTPYSVKKIN